MTNFSESIEMKRREKYSKDFYDKILDEEEHPMFCSDEACFLDLYVGDATEAKKLIFKNYNVLLSDEHLVMPFWKLLDLLYQNNTQI